MVCVGFDELAEFALGQLPEDQLQRVGEHIDACTRCNRIVLELQPIPADFALALPWRKPLEEIEQSSAYAVFRQRVGGVTLRSVQATQDPSSDPPATDQPAFAAMPARVGTYRLGERLGRGGMGEVFKAWHEHLKRDVAVKLLAANRHEDQASIRRFVWEMEAIGKLDDPHVVRALDGGVSDGRHYLVMELASGLDAAAVLRRVGPLRVCDAAEIARQAALGLAAVQRIGLVHRDIKPSNLMVCSSGIVKLLDLGLSRGSLTESRGDRLLTSSQNILGTVDYLSPEQVSAKSTVDIRSDIYGLGCTIYELLTGDPPFPDPQYPSIVAKLMAHGAEEPVLLTVARPDVPRDLALLVQRMLAKRADDRPATPAKVAEELCGFTAQADLVGLIGGASIAVAAAPRPAVATPASPTPKSMPRPLPGRKRRWLTRVALIGGLLLAAGSGALWWANHRNLVTQSQTEQTFPVTKTAGTSAPVAQPAEEPPEGRPLVWINHLTKPPQPIFWPGGGLSSWAYNPDLQQLTMNCSDTGLLSLGKRTSAHYRVEVGFQQNRWTGGFGLFFGLREAEVDGKPAERFQFIHFKSIAGEMKKFSLTRGWCAMYSPAQGPRQFTTFTSREAMVPSPFGEQLLAMEIDQQHLQVRLNGVAVGDLADDTVDARFQAADFQGEFGVYIFKSDAIVIQARSMAVSSDR